MKLFRFAMCVALSGLFLIGPPESQAEEKARVLKAKAPTTTRQIIECHPSKTGNMCIDDAPSQNNTEILTIVGIRPSL